MKKKMIVFVLVFFICLLICGCKKKDIEPNRRKMFNLVIVRPDRTIRVQDQGVYVFEENQTYILMFIPNSTIELLPEYIEFEYDETIFEIVCTTTPEEPGYGYTTLFYQLTCLKKCESTPFVAFLLREFAYSYEFTIQVV